jgi:hypothetical protein
LASRGRSFGWTTTADLRHTKKVFRAHAAWVCLSTLALLSSACADELTVADGSTSESSTSTSDDGGTEESGQPEGADELETESETETGSDESETETETGSDERDDEGEEEDTGVDPNLDPTCGEWSATKVRARGLDDVWTDGLDIVAVGDVDVIARGAGDWIDYDDTALAHEVTSIAHVWGSAVDDQWLIAAEQAAGLGVYHFDGQQLERRADFTYPEDEWGAVGNYPAALSGSGPNDVWALAVVNCDCFEPCPCEQLPTQVLHYDGQAWSELPSPGRAVDISIGGTTAWVVGTSGLVARFDGQGWIAEDVGEVLNGVLYSVWAAADDEVWAGGLSGELVHRSGDGVWTPWSLPSNQRVFALDGRSASEVWALTEYGELWAYDGSEWSLLAELPGARELAVLDDGLVVVGEDDGHWITRVDTDTGVTDPLYSRPDMRVQTLAVEDVDTAIVSGQTWGHTWRWSVDHFERVYADLDIGFTHIVTPLAPGFATRNTIVANGEGVWRLDDPAPTPLPDPVEDAEYWAALTFQGELWVAGKIDSGPYGEPFMLSYDGRAWTDRNPEIEQAYVVQNMTSAGGRLFAQWRRTYPYAEIIHYYEDGQWVDIANPEDVHPIEMHAAAKDQLWMTVVYTGGERGVRLWDGETWHEATELWPELLASSDWRAIDGAGPNDVWLLSSHDEQSELLARFDRESWTIIDTPAQLHGWSGSAQIQVGPDGLFAFDRRRIWRYAYCELP